MKENFKSAVHMIIMDGDNVLVQKRKGSKLWDGYYALPAGHIDKGENQYDALIREAREELGIDVKIDDTLSYVVLRRNHFKVDGILLDSYIDYYFVITNYKGTPKIMEEDKCSELVFCDIHNLLSPFINYEGDFLEDMSIKTYDCLEMGAYIKK